MTREEFEIFNPHLSDRERLTHDLDNVYAKTVALDGAFYVFRGEENVIVAIYPASSLAVRSTQAESE